MPINSIHLNDFNTYIHTNITLYITCNSSPRLSILTCSFPALACGYPGPFMPLMVSSSHSALIGSVSFLPVHAWTTSSHSSLTLGRATFWGSSLTLFTLCYRNPFTQSHYQTLVNRLVSNSTLAFRILWCVCKSFFPFLWDHNSVRNNDSWCFMAWCLERLRGIDFVLCHMTWGHSSVGCWIEGRIWIWNPYYSFGWDNRAKSCSR